MKLKYAFEFVSMQDDVIAVPVGSNSNQVCGILKMNKAGKEIIEHLQVDTSIQRIVDDLVSQYDNDPASIEIYVRGIVDSLRKEDLIEE